VAVVDELGLVVEGQYLTVFIPATYKAFVFQVISRLNRGYEVFDYGLIPLSTGDTLASLDTGSVTVPEDGVVPARSMTPLGSGIQFPLDGAYDETDMWYIPPESDYANRLFHEKTKVTPAFLKLGVEIPSGVEQSFFQTKVSGGIDKDFGFRRGEIELVHFPGIHYRLRVANDTNLNVYTYVRFIYAEYVVRIPKDASLICNILRRKIPSYWLSMPIQKYEEEIRRAFEKAYGFEGFPITATEEEIEEILKKAKI